MELKATDYQRWAHIRYEPAIRDHLPKRLLTLIDPPKRIIDIGCNTGGVARYLAALGHEVTGVDLNAEAIEAARHLACREGITHRTDFIVGDIRDLTLSAEFDVAIMNRLLTCVPELEAWRQVLSKAKSMLRVGGILNVCDFLVCDDYEERYEIGKKSGWRDGNFTVLKPDGSLRFIAHHHSRMDLEEIKGGCERLHYREFNSLSMNGNQCLMFEYIGRLRT